MVRRENAFILLGIALRPPSPSCHYQPRCEIVHRVSDEYSTLQDNVDLIHLARRMLGFVNTEMYILLP